MLSWNFSEFRVTSGAIVKEDPKQMSAARVGRDQGGSPLLDMRAALLLASKDQDLPVRPSNGIG
jgi:hypothetical protein